MLGYFKKSGLSFRIVALLICGFFSSSLILPEAGSASTPLNLPVPGTLMSHSSVFHPPIVKGMTLYPDHPLKFDFIIDSGEENLQGEAFRKEAGKLIKYFLASLTVPEEDLWVNLSPHEPDRIIPEKFGQTEMGRDLLAQDYLLKQLTASLSYPEHALGENFWKRVREKAYEQWSKTMLL